MLCVLLGGHLLLFWHISVGGYSRDARAAKDVPLALTWIEISEPIAPGASSQPSSEQRPISTYDPSVERRTPAATAIALPPETEASDARIDWNQEAARVAGDVVSRMNDEVKYRALDQPPKGLATPPESPRVKSGTSERFEGGVIIDWISERCYYSNQDAHVPAFGQGLRLQLPTCTGRASGGGSVQSFEDWKKEKAKQ